MLPRVIVHNEASIDGRITGFPVHMELYYRTARAFGEHATMVGTDTILATPDEVPEETEDDLKALRGVPDLDRPILVIPDSRGRVRVWHFLRRWPFWGRFVALVSSSTPGEYKEYLRDRNIDTICAGSDHVDLREALEVLNARYGVAVVRTDSGGTLNGQLLMHGLADEVSVLLNASIVGGRPATYLFNVPDARTKDDIIKLELVHMEQLEDNVVWLRYRVP